MTLKRFIIRSFQHYSLTHLATATGVAIATAVICGALIVGDSLRHSLKQIVDYRLGSVTHSITAGERVFTKKLAYRINQNSELAVTPVLRSEAMVVAQGGQNRLHKVQLWGVDSSFKKMTPGGNSAFEIDDAAVLVSQNVASRLMIDTGDFVQLHIVNKSPLPNNTPFVSEDNHTISRRVRVQALLDREEQGYFSLQSSQSKPYNVFVNLDWLNRVLTLNNNANLLLLKTPENYPDFKLKEALQKSWQLEDANLIINKTDGNNIQITSERVFIEHYISDEIAKAYPIAEKHLTYFVNSFKRDTAKTPYSFVAATNRKAVSGNNKIVINEWLAKDLNAKEKDTLTVTYYEIGALRELKERHASFVVSDILSMEEVVVDKKLMPHIPGLSDAGSCREWDAAIPIDLKSIRQKDEDYWNDFKGTPKAYITLEQGQSMWQNRFGKLTSVLIPMTTYTESSVREWLSKQLNPFKLEYQINAVREEGLHAARGAVDFAGLFAGLSMFIIIGGLILTVLLVHLGVKKRENQIKILSALGYSKSLISKILASETALIITTGAILGVLLSLVYVKFVFWALNSLWYDIVRTDVLTLKINGVTLIIGALIAMLLSFIVVWLSMRRLIQLSFRKKLHRNFKAIAKKRMLVLKLTTAFILTSSITLILYLSQFNTEEHLATWFVAGVMMLSGLLMLFYTYLKQTDVKPSLRVNTRSLSLKNINRFPGRSLNVVVLLTLGSFVIVLTAANRKNQDLDLTDKRGGHGGFNYMVETTAPFLKNLNAKDTRLEYGIPEEAHFVQFFTAYEDDASCLNLNMVANPRILATDPQMLKGRFSFNTLLTLVSEHEDPWYILNAAKGNLVPAVVDQTVIQWGLGKKIGDTLTYINAHGEELLILIAGGLSNSIFQGNIIISAANFKKHFPSANATDFLLVEAPHESAQRLREDLEFIFRDYGWQIRETQHVLSEFNTVQNTYLQIFFVMGAFGMLLGTIGLAVLIAKSLIARRNEIALLRTVGYSFRNITLMYVMEYTLLFVAGLFIGSISGVIATWPTFASANVNVNPAFLSTVLAVIITNGLLWITVVNVIMIKKVKLIEALRNE